MNLSGLTSLLHKHPAYRRLREEPQAEPLALLGAARAVLAAALAEDGTGPVVVLTGTHEQARRWVERLTYFLPPVEEGNAPRVHLFAEPDALPYERIAWTDRTRQQRLTALAAIQTQTPPWPVIVAPLRAALQKTLPARELRLALRPLSVGSFLRLEELTIRWVQIGYSPAQVVEEPGTFARRGGIIDIWPPNLPYPVRIDLFGDEVETLRIFDPATQRTVRRVERIEIGPGSEALAKYGPRVLARLAGKQATDAGEPPTFEETLLNDPHLLLAVREELQREVDHLAQAESFRGVEWYLPYMYAQPASLLDHMPSGGTLLLDDGGELRTLLEETETQVQRLHEELRRAGELPADFASSFFTGQEFLARLEAARPLILGYGDLSGAAQNADTPIARAFAPGPRYGGKTRQIVRDVGKFIDARDKVVLVSRQAARLQAELEEADIPVHLQSELDRTPGPGATLLQGIVDEGFVLRETEDGARVLLLTDAELFGWQKTATRKQRRTQSTVAPELFFADVKPGDYVVHMEHGIGQYEGLVKLELGGVEREYLQVNYAQGDKLYVPVHQADRLSKYVGAGDSGVPPAITRLGTADWQLAKARAQRAVEEIAEDLLALYAERELVRGHAFSPDSTWQEEMEAAFPFQETEDQLQVIQEVKRDMESEQPMDRIIIGDVGYGKTEVAVRAAFKAVMDGKQVAVLVPTTVLAQQHFRTFSQRLAPFPVRVEMLSRFRTPAQQQAVLRGLEDGTVDIVIGTHRLLSQDVTFKDLGLLVVDEEQRFGVAHKERLKQLRTQVDVLTLSATPIPRTLHMSLSGVRDMSTITTPPQERLPVRTVLSEYDEVLVRQAIQRELERGGQVFFVHNRVRGLQVLAQRVQRLVPDAVVAVAHGQMPERALEETMLRFAEGEIDVLVCTTIVENGLDIRRANTMIINRADHFGLAQLYQLRGRVGRGAERGYCYLLHDKHKALSFDARRRLEALLESSEELGAGFRIAMRDLEIRGAGELLGARQHGQIAAVGFDLYTRLLTQAVNDLRRKKKQFEAATGRGDEATATRSPETGPHQEGPPLPFAMDDPLAPPVTLDLPFVAEIPARYVPEEELRLQLYRRIAGLSTEEEIEAMRQELVDRFGKDPETSTVPEEIANLFYQILVKARALKAGVPNIGRRRDQIAIRIPEMPDKARRALQQRLRMALGHTTDEGEFIPENSVHVGREAAYIPIDQDGYWRLLLLRALDVLVAEERATDKSPAQSRNA